MIPYYSLHSFQLGPVTIQVWGLCVALGILAAVFVMRRKCKKYYVSADIITDLSLWCLLGAFLGARIFHVVFYNLGYYIQNPTSIFKVWEGGLSSTGGFVGGALAAYIFIKIKKINKADIVKYVDIASLGLWLGWGIGRIGCFLIHDHPGTLTHFIGGVQYPGGTRHDLGLYESIVGFCLFILFSVLFKKLIKKQWGLVAIFSWMSYAILRFGLDFLRATDLQQSDARYFHLTPAQWGMLGLFITLTIVVVSGIMKPTRKHGEVA